MASEQFSLCWDNFHKNMSSGLNGLLESEELVDVTLAVEGKCLKAHKMVLSVCSPYFKELFKTNPCQHPIVFMKDVSYVAISDLLQFMYQGEVQVSQDNLTTFIKTAEALQIKGLTGDGNGSADAETDSTHDVKSTASSGRQHAAEPEYKPRPKKQPVPSPISVPPPITSKAPKRPRLSVSSNDSQSNPSVPSTITKTEPISILPETNASATSAGGGAPLQQFKVEPYDQNQSVTIPDDGDDNFGDDTLDDTTVDDTEDYSMMEGEETEPQAGTSADGTGEGQDDTYLFETEATELLENDLDAKLNNLPAKSRKCYEKAYQEFLTWCTEKTLSITRGLTEDALIDYFDDKSKRHKPTSLWCYYSMLKSTINLNNNVDISEYPRLLKFLKQTCKGYAPVKSKFLTKQEVETFLIEAPDESYLFLKVALIFGICGACRCEELAKLETNDIQDLETSLLISIKESKTKIDRMFMVVDGKHSLPSFIGLYRKYLALRPGQTEHNRFFVNYKNSKCTAQVVGRNAFGEIPRKIAVYLNLPDSHRYTGHCFRRTSASMHTEAEENLKNTNIKMYGGW